MAKYMFESDHEIDCCFDCRMLFNDCCTLADHDNRDEKDTIPSWCPLEPVEGAFCVNESCGCCDERETCSGALRVVR